MSSSTQISIGLLVPPTDDWIPPDCTTLYPHIRFVSCGLGITPVSSMSTAMINALRANGIRRVALATAYNDKLNFDLVKFLNEHDIAVTAAKGLGLTNISSVRPTSPATIRDLAKEVVRELFGEEDENALIERTLETRLRGNPERLKDPRERRKVLAYLVRQGFSASAASTAIRNKSKR